MKDGIDEALGLDTAKIVVYDGTIEPPKDVVPTNAEDDLEYARRNVREAIDNAREAVAVMADVVKTSGSHKEAEALSNLLDKYVAANERLVNISKQPVTKNGEGPSKVVNNTQNVVMMGSTNDLLKMMNKSRGETDIEDDLEDER